MRTNARLIALLLASCALGSHAHQAPHHDKSDPSDASAESGWGPVAAHYRVSFKLAPSKVKPGTSSPAVQDWYFIRQNNLIATLRPDSAELWRQTPQGLSLERVFHPERHVVEYTPGELKTMGIQAQWRQLSSPFDAQALRQLKPGAKQGSLQDFSGTLNGEQVKLTWDHAQHLPHKLLRSNKTGSFSMSRISSVQSSPLDLSKVSAPNWPAAWPETESGLLAYQRLDASDFGDMADNPVVRKAEALDIQQGWRQAHAHSHN